MPQSRIKTLQFTSDYNPPSGGVLYLHAIEFEDGTKGKTYLKTKLPAELLGGTECTYVNANGTIKQIYPVQPPVSVETSPANNSGTGAGSNQAIVGYACQHAKDIIMSKIAAKEKGLDIEKEYVKLSTAFYKHMLDLPNLPL